MSVSTPQQAKTDQIAGRIDPAVTGSMLMSKSGPVVPIFGTMQEILEFAKVMSVSGVAIRKHLRNNPGACAAICMQAQRWEMDPFMVGNKSYEVNDQIAYESQLVAAVVNTRAPIKGRLKTRFVGEGQQRQCIVSGWIIGEDEPTEVISPRLLDIKPKNSPLWGSDPDQQLSYYTKRAWARREVPEVLLGVFDIDELTTPIGPDTARDVTPPRPKRSDFVTEAPPVIEPTAQEEAAADRAAAEFARTGGQPAEDETATDEAHDPKTGEILEGKADEPVDFWRRESLEIVPTAVGKSHDWNGWKREFLQRLAEAASGADATALERWNHDHIAALSLKYAQTGEEVKQAINDRLAALDGAEG